MTISIWFNNIEKYVKKKKYICYFNLAIVYYQHFHNFCCTLKTIK